MLVQFLEHNLVPSIAAGLIIAGAVEILVHRGMVQSSQTKNSLLLIAVAKSTLVLTGFGFALPASIEYVTGREATPVPMGWVLPVLLVWVGILVLAREFVVQKVISPKFNEQSRPDLEDRVGRALSRVYGLFQSAGAVTSRRISCSVSRGFAEPVVRFTSDARAPAIATSASSPVLFLSVPLVDQLDDQELDGVLAHELAHQVIQDTQPLCAPGWTRPLGWISPANFLIRGIMRREEEMACDEIAHHVTQNPAALASALVKTQRLTLSTSPRLASVVSRLTSDNRILPMRVSRLLAASVDQTKGRGEPLAWFLILGLAIVL